MFRRLFATLLCALALVWPLAHAAERPIAAYDRVEIAPTKTSIYLGSVSLTMPAFVRKSGDYEATYAARVFPFYIGSEKGSMTITLSDADLRKLEKGETIEFSGRAKNTDGEERRIEAKATPADASSGKLKVRVFVSKRIELIFNTTYRFQESPAPSAP